MMDRKRPGEDQSAAFGKRTHHAGAHMLVKLVCADNRAGAIIGKGGSFLKLIRELTGADVVVDKSMPGVPDRLVHLSSSIMSLTQETLSPVQSALMMVIDKLAETEVGQERSHIEVRLLVDSGAAAAVTSASSAPPGVLLLDVRKYCGAAVIVAPPAGRPVQAAFSDEYITVSGHLDSVHEGVRVVTDRLREVILGLRPPPLPDVLHPAAANAHSLASVGLPNSGGGARPAGRPLRQQAGLFPSGGPLVATEYRLAVQDKQIGCILGKGGQLANIIREQTGSELRIERALPGASDRLVVCASTEPPESDFCAAADALVVCLDKLVQEHLQQAGRGGPPLHAFRVVLLLRPIQAAVISARGGSTMMQIQGDTQAHVALLPPDALPRCAEPGDGALMIEGVPNVVFAAVRAVSILLRSCQVCSHLGLPQVDSTGALIHIPPQLQSTNVYPSGTSSTSSAALQPYYASPAAGPSGVFNGSLGAAVAAPYRSATTAAGGIGFGGGGSDLVITAAGPRVKAGGGVGAGGLGTDGASAAGGAAGGEVSMSMMLVQAQASALLGRGGSTISHIRSVSGAKLKLHTPLSTADGVRELVITGAAPQASAAHHMVMNVVGNSSLGTPPVTTINPAADTTPSAGPLPHSATAANGAAATTHQQQQHTPMDTDAAAASHLHSSGGDQEQLQLLLPSPPAELPAISELPAFFESSTVASRVPVDAFTFRQLEAAGLPSEALAHVTACGASALTRALSPLVAVAASWQQQQLSSAAPMHSELDTTILMARFLGDTFAVLREVGPSLDYELVLRPEAADIPIAHADVSTALLADGSVLLVGEEAKANCLVVAAARLRIKLQGLDVTLQPRGPVQFLLAYTAAGRQVQLHAASASSDQQVVLTPLTAVYDLALPADCASFVISLAKAYSLLVCMVRNLPSPDGDTLVASAPEGEHAASQAD